jgi:hypothetical protein
LLAKDFCFTVDNDCIDPSWAARHGENLFSEHPRNGCADLRQNQKPDIETTVLVWQVFQLETGA